MEKMITSLLPVFLILTTGIIARKSKIISKETIGGLKIIIIRFALPGILFLAFAQAELQVETWFIVIVVFIFCAVLFLIGMLLHKFLPRFFPDEYTDGYFTGFEFGMIGTGLFTAIWGIEKLPIIAIIAFGHEIFIWFVYIPLIQARQSGRVNIRKTLKNFITTPATIGIMLGILVNILKLYPVIDRNIAGTSVFNALKMLGNVIAPLILMVIGYALEFEAIPVKKTITLLLSRWLLVIGLGILVVHILGIINPDMDAFIIRTFYAFILLPPPFVLPIIIRTDNTQEIGYFSVLLIYYTMLSLIAYIILMSV